MKKKILSVFVLGLVLAGCSHGATTTETDLTAVNEEFEGKIVQGIGEDNYQLIMGPGEILELRRGNSDLSVFLNQEVRVTGQFSGSTLYVDEVNSPRQK